MRKPSFSRPPHFLLLLTSSLIVNALALALPMMTMQVYDRILSNRATDTLTVLAGGVMLAAIAEFILRVCRSVVVGLNGAQYEHEAAATALQRVMETEPRSVPPAAAAALAQDIGAAARLKDYYGGQMMVTLLIDAPFISIFLALDAWLGGWLVLAPVLVLSTFVFLSYRHGRRLRMLIKHRELQDHARYTYISDVLRAVHGVKALCLEAPLARRFEDVQRDNGAVNYDIARLHGLAGSLSYGFGQLMTVAVIGFGAPLAIEAKITVGTLIACVLLSGQIMQPLQRGLGIWIRFQDMVIARERIARLLALPQRPSLNADNLAFNHGEVKIRSMCFAWPDADNLFDRVNLHLAPGETVALQGESGAGKTALLEIMAGIYAPDRGGVTVSGMEIAAVPASERARYVAYLPMRGITLRGSIMDNLTGFDPRLRAEARLVADRLGIEEAVALLPSGYDTPLEGQISDVVSPGLKQRIAVARALLHKPRLILFDNADHGMDHESYVRIFEILARLKGKATLVLVSDDRNILSLAARTLHLKDGRFTAPDTGAYPPGKAAMGASV